VTLTHVLTPIRIADVEVRNRVVRTAHATLLGGGTMSDDLIAYHLARGRGGVGLSIIETLAVHWSTPTGLNIFVPGIEDKYRELVEKIRPTGMKLFQQLWHAGHNSAPLDGGPPWSSSDLPGYLQGIPAVPMTKNMIDGIVGAYADTARKMADWGIDGVEVHAAHGYLPIQFLSPILNNRTDEYGGPFENRIRFLYEVMAAIRSAVPKGYPIGMRISPDENPGFVSTEENVAAARFLQQRGLLDFVNVSLGNYQTIRKPIGGMHEPTGYQVPTSSPITHALTLPSIVTGRFRTLEEADHVIRAGDASMVSFVRALIADPELVNKTAAGHPEQVRPCIACNQGCVGRVLEPPFRMGCAINAGAGFELSLDDARLVKARFPRRVLVVGGGPAGMEAARVAALRGHRVVLAEATASLGGTVLAAAKAPTRQTLRDFTTWLEEENYRLGVDVRLSSYLEADDVVAESWDAVIVATGSSPRMDGVQQSNLGEPVLGMQQPHVISSNDLMLGSHSRLGRSAVVIDDAGHYEALAVADYLVEKGLDVIFVTRHISVAPKVESALMVEPALIRLARGKFSAHVRTRALSIGRDTVTICPIYLPSSSKCSTTLPADTVVFVSLNRSRRELYDALAERVPDVRIVGDANSARHLPAAVREGHLAGAAI
jgi:2,4-dienoyl-CoA reductase-like NADH-dependent reductase (Old Yellow Enzyme family)/thioredoxin reductase